MSDKFKLHMTCLNMSYFTAGNRRVIYFAKMSLAIDFLNNLIRTFVISIISIRNQAVDWGYRINLKLIK